VDADEDVKYERNERRPDVQEDIPPDTGLDAFPYTCILLIRY
jgi:hypothetical protein